MGKYILFVTLAGVLGTTFFTYHSNDTTLETAKDQAQRERTVLARQIARSAFGIAQSKIRQDFENWRIDRNGVPYEGGTFDLSAIGPSNGPVAITAVGHHGDAVYRISATVERKTILPSFFSALTVRSSPATFDVSGPGCSGGACVSGLDEGGGEDRNGISLPPNPNEDSTHVCNEFGDKVEGVRGRCDVLTRGAQRNQEVVRKIDEIEARIQSLPSNQVTVCGSGSGGHGRGRGGGGNCRMSGAHGGGDGILYVEGDLRINGNAQWNGLVFVAQGGSVRINGGGGALNVNGGMIMEGNNELDMNGGNRIKYNSGEILDLDQQLQVGEQVIQVTGRRDCNVKLRSNGQCS